MNTSKYYILVKEDLVPQYPHSSTGVTEIAISADNEHNNYPIAIMEGKGHGFSGANMSAEEIINSIEFFPLFEKSKIVWILDFIKNTPNFTEDSLKKEISLYGLELVTEEL